MTSSSSYLLLVGCLLAVVVCAGTVRSNRGHRLRSRPSERHQARNVDTDQLHDDVIDDDDDVTRLSRRQERWRPRGDFGEEAIMSRRNQSRRRAHDDGGRSRHGRRGHQRRRIGNNVPRLVQMLQMMTSTSPPSTTTDHQHITDRSTPESPGGSTGVIYYDFDAEDDEYNDDVDDDVIVDEDGDLHDDDVTASTSQAITDHRMQVHRAVNACEVTTCPRNKVCLLNIQGLPMCRCRTVYHCKGVDWRPLCTVDGRMYKNRCLLRVDECAANRRIQFHWGTCRDSPEGRLALDSIHKDVGRRQRHRQRSTGRTAGEDEGTDHGQDSVHDRRRARRRRPHGLVVAPRRLRH